MAGAGRLYAAVGAGSALGSPARTSCRIGLVALLGPAFPWGTLAVNGLGLFLIGLYAVMSGPGGRLPASPAQRQFMMAGFCGDFTTFSIFSLESVLLVEHQAVGAAGIYVTASVATWLACAWVGHRIGASLNHAA